MKFNIYQIAPSELKDSDLSETDLSEVNPNSIVDTSVNVVTMTLKDFADLVTATKLFSDITFMLQGELDKLSGVSTEIHPDAIKFQQNIDHIIAEIRKYETA